MGTIYFLGDPALAGPVKIGFTTRTAAARRTAAQVFRPDAVAVLAEAPGDRATEAALHAAFAPTRVRGEWFAPSAALRELIAAVHEGVGLRDYVAGL